MASEGEIKYDEQGNTWQFQNGTWVLILTANGQHKSMVIPTVEKVSDDTKGKKPGRK